MKDLQQNLQFQQALKLHQGGRLNEARNLYLALLDIYPNSPRLLNNLAMIEFQLGQFLVGLEYIEKSIEIDPAQFSAYGNRGAALFALNRFEEAYQDFNHAIALNSNYSDAYYNRALLHEKKENYEEALTDYDHAIASRPDYANAYNNRGNILKKLERYEEALASYDDAIKFNNHHAEAYSNRGVVLKALRKYHEALDSYHKAIALNSDYVEAYTNCGNVLLELNKFEDALNYLQKAIQINPSYVCAYTSQGNAFMELMKFSEALLSYDKAIVLRSSVLNSVSKKNHAFEEKKRITLPIDSDIADTYWNKALLKILLGEFDEGWQLYEYRRHRKGQEKYYPNYIQPLWLGKDTPINKRLFIYPEQGLGDFIQFCRYVPLVEKLGAKVLLSVPAPLLSLIKTMRLNAKIIKNDEKVKSIDLHCPIMSLPLAFKTTLESIPDNVPYFFSDETKKDYWQKKISSSKNILKVGLVWSGSKEHMKDHNRSIQLEKLEPLLSLPIEFYSLQKEIREQDKATISRLNRINQFSEDLIDFSDTAALVDCLDLIITVDTSVAHLAGAMAKNVWVLLSYLPDYRWMLDRDDSPWYPTAKLFRQPNPGDWDSVIVTVKSALENMLSN